MFHFASGYINYFHINYFHILMFDCILDTPLTCLKKDKNCRKPAKKLFLETLQQRLRNNFLEISEKKTTEK